MPEFSNSNISFSAFLDGTLTFFGGANAAGIGTGGGGSWNSIEFHNGSYFINDELFRAGIGSGLTNFTASTINSIKFHSGNFPVIGGVQLDSGKDFNCRKIVIRGDFGIVVEIGGIGKGAGITCR